jgi:AcrR family transcriptional regulator
VSTKGERTRQHVLDAAVLLFRAHGPTLVTMADVARSAGLTRQALYLHFPSRTTLMLALIQHAGEKLGAPQLFRREKGSPRAMLRFLLRASAQYAERVHEIATALDIARHSDADARAAWDDRMALRRRSLHGIVRRLHAEGALRDGWTVRQVVDALWALSAPRTYADLVVERGWPLATYERFLLTSAAAFLKRRRSSG